MPEFHVETIYQVFKRLVSQEFIQKNIHLDLGKWIDFRKWYFVNEFLVINPAGYKKRQQCQKLAMKK